MAKSNTFSPQYPDSRLDSSDEVGRLGFPLFRPRLDFFEAAIDLVVERSELPLMPGSDILLRNPIS
jgi:hypothetical protein